MTRFKMITFTARIILIICSLISLFKGLWGLEDDYYSQHELFISPNPVQSGSNLSIQYVEGNKPVTFILRNLQGEEVKRIKVNELVAFDLNIIENILEHIISWK